MIAGLDSSFDAPALATARAAQAAGVPLWSGYLGTRGGLGLAVIWQRWQFDIARLCGATPLGFCSGWDDPAGVRQLGQEWSVRPCLDVESGIRPDGPWVQGWLGTSGAGLYGGSAVHDGRRAAFHVLAAYPGFDPGATWSRALARPSGPVGWQWQGSHPEFGRQVDRGWYDDWFGGGQAGDPYALSYIGGDS